MPTEYIPKSSSFAFTRVFYSLISIVVGICWVSTNPLFLPGNVFDGVRWLHIPIPLLGAVMIGFGIGTLIKESRLIAYFVGAIFWSYLALLCTVTAVIHICHGEPASVIVVGLLYVASVAWWAGAKYIIDHQAGAYPHDHV